jgi:hypothetical protein
MKVISLLQPWATLVTLGAKQWETRTWSTQYRGPLLIHASAKKPTRREKQLYEEDFYFKKYILNTDYLPYGAIIGKINLVTIVPTGLLLQHLEHYNNTDWKQELSFDDYSLNRFAWKLEAAETLIHFLPMKGTLGLWEYNGFI